MKRPPVVFAVIMAFLMGGSLVAQGLSLELASSAYVVDSGSLSGEVAEDAILGLTFPLGRLSKFSINVDASVAYDFDSSWSGDLTYPSVSGESPYLGNLAIQEFAYYFGGPVENEGLSRLVTTIGRFPYADPTGAIYSYRLDGLVIGASYPIVTLRAILGYTGFLPASDGMILEGSSDSLYGNEGFAPPRAFAAFSLRPPRIAGHDFYLAFIAQEDLRNQTQLIPEYETIADYQMGGPMDSAYLAAGFSGAVSRFSYSGFGIYEFGRKLSYLEDSSSDTSYRYLYAPLSAFAFGGVFRFPLSSRLSLATRFLFGSGDADAESDVDGNTAGDATFFSPITTASSGLAFSPEPGNVTMLEVTTRYQPFSGSSIGTASLLLTGKSYVFVKNGRGPISEAGVSADSGAGLLGVEQDLSATIRLLSDVSASLSCGAFVPFSGSLGVFDASYVEATPVMYKISASLSLTL